MAFPCTTHFIWLFPPTSARAVVSQCLPLYFPITCVLLSTQRRHLFSVPFLVSWIPEVLQVKQQQKSEESKLGPLYEQKHVTFVLLSCFNRIIFSRSLHLPANFFSQLKNFLSRISYIGAIFTSFLSSFPSFQFILASPLSLKFMSSFSLLNMYEYIHIWICICTKIKM